MDDVSIDIHYAKLEEWLVDRSAVIKKQHPKTYTAVLAAAPMLIQKVKYDLPATRKQVNKAEGAAKEAKGAINDAIRTSAQARATRSELLAKYGLASNREEEEQVLAGLDHALNLRLAKAAATLEHQLRQRASGRDDAYKGVTLQRCLDEYYVTMVKQLQHSMSDVEAKAIADEPAFFWLPRLASESTSNTTSLDECISRVKTEMGISGTSDAAGAGAEPVLDLDIDWGDDAPAAAAAEPAIVLDLDDLEPPPTASGSKQPQGADQLLSATGIAGASMPAPPKETPVLIWEERHRAPIVDELCALTAFYGEQLAQQADGGTVLSCGGDEGKVKAMHELLKSMTALVDDEVTTDLLRMHSSYRHKERFLRRIEQLGFNASAKEQRKKDLEDRAVAAEEEAEKLRPEADVMIAEIKELQKKCEQMLSEVYKPRSVKLVGDLNSI